MITQRPFTCVIPVFNNVEEVRNTIHSIRTQEYDENKIFYMFVDFGSTDATRELLWSQPSKNTGVIDFSGRPVSRTIQAWGLRALSFQAAPGMRLVLTPGDILYPYALKQINKMLSNAWREQINIDGLVAEVDLIDEDGKISHQAPLFTSHALLRSFSTDSIAYVDHGYKHQILLVGSFTSSTDKIATYRSYVRHWNQAHYIGLYHNLLYVSDPVACMRQFHPQDELDDLLFRFETGIAAMLGANTNDFVLLDKGFESAFRTNLGYYALWRTWQCWRRGNKKVAEDCFILSRIINPQISEYEVYQRLERLLAQGQEEDDIYLEAFFAQEEPPQTPRWPFGGYAAQLKRKWRSWINPSPQGSFGT